MDSLLADFKNNIKEIQDKYNVSANIAACNFLNYGNGNSDICTECNMISTCAKIDAKDLPTIADFTNKLKQKGCNAERLGSAIEDAAKRSHLTQDKNND